MSVLFWTVQNGFCIRAGSKSIISRSNNYGHNGGVYSEIIKTWTPPLEEKYSSHYGWLDGILLNRICSDWLLNYDTGRRISCPNLWK